MKYELVLGLEIHLQLTTERKMFCSCKNEPFNSDPNINVCPVCLGLPGALPVLNQEAINKAQLFVAALKSKLNEKIIFERKNYFYPDIPKGYQITCPHYPIGVGGSLNIDDIEIKFREIHLEEDTAKSLHKDGKTFVDYNKSGVPLLEIVTEPDFKSVDQAVKFSKEIQLIARKLKISDADMEKGQMRLEANISVRKKEEKQLPNYRVEIKNINSFSFMKKAVEYELRRQSEALDKGDTLQQETRGFNEVKGITVVQRSKENAHDYRYFPEPDIPPLEFSTSELQKITTSLPDMPSVLRSKLQEDGLNLQYVEIFIQDELIYSKYLDLLNLGYIPLKAADLVINISSYKNSSANEIHQLEMKKRENKIDNSDELKQFALKVTELNPKAVEDFKAGSENSLQFLIGQIMKETNGKADPLLSKQVLIDLLKNK